MDKEVFIVRRGFLTPIFFEDPLYCPAPFFNVFNLNVSDKLSILLEFATSLLKFWYSLKQIWRLSLQCPYTKDIFDMYL